MRFRSESRSSLSRPPAAVPGPPAARLSRPLVALLATACGLAVATVYFAQPVLDAVAASFGITESRIGVVIAVTQAGYAVGLLTLVPLGDLVDRRRLVAVQLALAAVALVVVGTAQSATILLVGLAAVGVLAVVAQVLVAFAVSLAGPGESAAVVGMVTSGIVVGIVAARTFAGLVTQLAGWRAVYLTSATLTLVLCGLLLRALPQTPPSAPGIRYRELLRSMAWLYRTERALRVRALLAMLIFAALNVLWTPLALQLSAPPLALSHGAIGLLGLAGVAGALAAVQAGRLADRGHAEVTTGVALAILLLAWLPIGLVEHSVAALVVGLLLLDLAVQAVHVTSQSIIYRIDPTARSRLVGVYMVFYSIGSAAGSLAASAIYASTGWSGVCLLGAGISATAILLWAGTLNWRDGERGQWSA